MSQSKKNKLAQLIIEATRNGLCAQAHAVPDNRRFSSDSLKHHSELAEPKVFSNLGGTSIVIIGPSAGGDARMQDKVSE